MYICTTDNCWSLCCGSGSGLIYRTTSCWEVGFGSGSSKWKAGSYKGSRRSHAGSPWRPVGRLTPEPWRVWRPERQIRDITFLKKGSGSASVWRPERQIRDITLKKKGSGSASKRKLLYEFGPEPASAWKAGSGSESASSGWAGSTTLVWTKE